MISIEQYQLSPDLYVRFQEAVGAIEEDIKQKTGLPPIVCAYTAAKIAVRIIRLTLESIEGEKDEGIH